MKNIALAAGLAAATFVVAPAAQADPAFGLGLTYTFGASGKSDVALGARIFSSDKPQDFAASIGLDYKFGSGSIRPSIGAAYLENNWYSDLSIGYDTGAGEIDFGLGAGGWRN